MTDTLNESLQHYHAKAKTCCAKSKALSYYLDFMFSYKLELGRVTLRSEITWENWHSRCAQVLPTIMSVWTCFQKTNISIHTFCFFSEMKVMPHICQMPKLKKDSTLVELDVFLAMFCGLECNIALRQKLNQMRKWLRISHPQSANQSCMVFPKPNFLPHSLGMLELDVR